MKFNIHHISAIVSILRSPESCRLFLSEQKGDFMYIKKREYYKDTLR